MANNVCRIIYIHQPGASCEKCNFKAFWLGIEPTTLECYTMRSSQLS